MSPIVYNFWSCRFYTMTNCNILGWKSGPFTKAHFSHIVMIPCSAHDYMSYFPRFSIPCEERGKKWNSSWGNEEISRNLFTLKKHLIIAKSKHKVSIPKSTKFFVKFLTTKNFFIVFSCIKFFQIIFFLIFLEFFYSIL